MKLDNEGSLNLQTGDRIISIMPQELEDGPILGQGNGGLVRVAIHKQLGIPFAVKVSKI